MKMLRIALIGCTMIMLATAGAALAADEGQPDMQKMMEMMQAGPEHKTMGKVVGKWNAAGKMWMDPSAPPQESQGAMEYKADLEGRYFIGTFTSNFMGMPFEGRSVDGYDRYNQEYFSYWYDNMGTGMMAMRGKASADGKVITMKGSSFDPMVGANAEFKTVTTWVDDNTIKYEMYGVKNGRDTKVMEMLYTRM